MLHVNDYHCFFFLTQAEGHDNDLPGVENMVTRQLLGSSHHLLSADDTNIVGGLQVFRSCIRVANQKEKTGKKLPQSYCMYLHTHTLTLIALFADKVILKSLCVNLT